MKRFLSLWFLLAGLLPVGFAQEFRYKAELPEVPENGFYRVVLKPDVLNRSQPGFADIRLYNRKNREVPYLLERTEALQTKKHFREYPIISRNIHHGVNTTLIIQNKSRNKIDNIGLLIKNTNVVKKASLRGSADGQNWFALEDNYVLQSVTNTQETSEVKVLPFPLSDYEFYRLEINDSASAPLNILAAGYYDFSAEEGDYTEVKSITFTQTDSAAVKKTFLHFRFSGPVLIDKLTFEINGPTFYRRSATVFENQTVYSRNRRRKHTEMVAVQTFQLESDSKNALPLPGFRSGEFLVVIDNADNPPLQFEAVRAFQLNTFLVAELRKGERYELRIGHEKIAPPAYDLPYFREKIPLQLPVLAVGSLTEIQDPGSGGIALNRFFQTRVLIWVALVLVVFFLAFMTYQMLKESPNK